MDDKGLLRLAITSIVLVLGGIALWSITTQLSEAIVTTGEVTTEIRRQAIEHSQGGKIVEYLVTEDALVERGAALVRLDASESSSE